jgi:hypothetical protein
MRQFTCQERNSFKRILGQFISEVWNCLFVEIKSRFLYGNMGEPICKSMGHSMRGSMRQFHIQFSFVWESMGKFLRGTVGHFICEGMGLSPINQ